MRVDLHSNTWPDWKTVDWHQIPRVGEVVYTTGSRQRVVDVQWECDDSGDLIGVDIYLSI